MFYIRATSFYSQVFNYFQLQVMQFLLRQKHSRKHILVHCTHGHNRTGYMIIHYLMRSMSMSVTQVSVGVTI